jgi:hypothetical protein
MATSLHTEVLLKTRVFQSSVWAVDSGATHHFCNDDSYFQNAHSRTINMPIRLGDNNSVLAQKEGPITLQGSLNLHALFVPDFRISLLSVPQFDKQGWTTTFSHERCLITNTNGKVLISATLRNGLYLVDSFALITTRSGRHLTPPPSIITETPPSIVTETPSEVEQSPGDEISLEKSTEILTPAAPDTSAGPKARFRKDNLEVKRSDSIAIWHRRLAHLHPSAMKKLLNIPLHGKNDISGCDTCIQAKHQQKFQRSVPSTRSTVPFELIHSDLCGPLNHSVGGASYYIVYIDDCTRWTEVYPLIGKTAAEITAKFQHFKAWVETQGRRIKRFRCDNGRGEYNNALFLEILASSGITYEPAPPYTQHKNGVAERMIRTLNTKARAMLLDAGLPMTFWGEAIKTACYLHHRTPTSSLIDFKSPYELLHGVKPRLHHLRRFGCTVYKHIPKEQRHDKKFGIRSRPCMMIGYVHKTTKIWRLWDWQTKRAIECSNTIFREDENAIEATMDNAEAAMQRYDYAVQFPTDNEEIDDSNADDIIEDMSRMLTFILSTAFLFFIFHMANVATGQRCRFMVKDTTLMANVAIGQRCCFMVKDTTLQIWPTLPPAKDAALWSKIPLYKYGQRCHRPVTPVARVEG